VFRALGSRAASEIERERYALEAARSPPRGRSLNRATSPAPILEVTAARPHDEMARDRITYDVGNENNPGNPFGRQHLVIEVDGRARLDHHTIGPHFAWTGVVRGSVLDRFWDALARADFPSIPQHPVPAGSTMRALGVGVGLAARRAYLAYHARAAGYDEAFALLDALIRQLSEDTVPVVPASAEVLVDEVRATEEAAPSKLSAGMIYLLAYLPGHAIAHASWLDFLARFVAGGDPALQHAVDFAGRAAKIEASRVEGASRRIGALLRQAELAIPANAELPEWRLVADAVHPLLTTPVLQSAWSAGEAARLVSIAVALLVRVAYLRCAAPTHEELLAHAEARAQALEENAATLEARLGATGLPWVTSTAGSVAKMVQLTRSHHLAITSDDYAQLSTLQRDLDGLLDGLAARFDATPSIGDAPSRVSVTPNER
jgi:hypothetical protein